jgi:hypothetical protein
MSAIKKLEPLSDTPYMKAKISDNNVYYVDASYNSHAYQCLGCGLVWDRKNLALDCERHKHAPHYEVRYGGRVENGQWVGGTSYPRRAIRRERIAQPALFGGAR